MDKIIEILYIDDTADIDMQRFLKGLPGKTNNQYHAASYKFKETDKLLTMLLENEKVIQADLIIVDSRLFNDAMADSANQTGELFKLLAKKLYPYKEIIVITRNQLVEEDTLTLRKYEENFEENAVDWYMKTLFPKMELARKSIIENIRIVDNESLADEDSVVLIDEIRKSIKTGSAIDEPITKNELDGLIGIFEEVKRTFEK